MEERLYLASGALAPASQYIQEASFVFEHEVEQYEEAYTLDSPESLELAVEKSAFIGITLDKIAALPLPQEKKDAVRNLRAEMKNFSEKAVHAYKDILSRLDSMEDAEAAIV